jgi:hypothetical protein
MASTPEPVPTAMASHARRPAINREETKQDSGTASTTKIVVEEGQAR